MVVIRKFFSNLFCSQPIRLLETATIVNPAHAQVVTLQSRCGVMKCQSRAIDDTTGPNGSSDGDNSTAKPKDYSSFLVASRTHFFLLDGTDRPDSPAGRNLRHAHLQVQNR